MKIKAILMSLLFAYGVTGLALAILAFLMYRFSIAREPVMASLAAVYVFSCFAGGFLAGRILRKEKYAWGLLSGLAYFVLLLAVSYLAGGRFDLTLIHGITVFLLCLGGGALGGMLS